jgi:hypothetical protein
LPQWHADCRRILQEHSQRLYLVREQIIVFALEVGDQDPVPKARSQQDQEERGGGVPGGKLRR